MESQMRTFKSQLDHERELRISTEMDVSKLRNEVEELMVEKSRAESAQEQTLNDMKIQND